MDTAAVIAALFTFNSGAITAFAALMNAAQAAGWKVQPWAYPSANWAVLATTTPGPYARSPGGLMGGAGDQPLY